MTESESVALPLGDTPKYNFYHINIALFLAIFNTFIVFIQIFVKKYAITNLLWHTKILNFHFATACIVAITNKVFNGFAVFKHFVKRFNKFSAVSRIV